MTTQPNSLQRYATRLEQRIASRIVDDALSAGFAVSVNDGEEVTVSRSSDRAAILDALATTDSDRLIFRLDGKLVGWVWLIWGNEHDLISDYRDNDAIRLLLTQAELIADAAS